MFASQILNGPVIMIRLKANVTMPDMHISDDALDFGDVKCGECRVVIVQLHNYQHVKCDWNSLPSDKDKKQVHLYLIIRCPQYNGFGYSTGHVLASKMANF